MKNLLGVTKHPEFRNGAKDALPQLPGLAAWGLMTGVAMIQSGLSLWEAMLMGSTVNAGSSQLAALPLLASGAPMWVVLSASFFVNLRFLVFSAHLRPYFMHHSLSRRLLTGYLGTDLTYVTFTARFKEPAQDHAGQVAQDSYWFGNAAVYWSVWAFTGQLGIMLANFIPPGWGLGFAGVLSLIGVLCSLIRTKVRALSAAIAGIVAVLAFAVPFKLNILIAIAAAALVCNLVEKTPMFKSRRKADSAHHGDVA